MTYIRKFFNYFSFCCEFCCGDNLSLNLEYKKIV